MSDLDERDQKILADRLDELNKVDGPRVGDYVIFADGVVRRISYVWAFEDEPQRVQTSDTGSFYLGHGHVRMSGGLFPPVSAETLTLTDEKRGGSVWFFHHDWWTAGNGVEATVEFRVFTCTEEAPR